MQNLNRRTFLRGVTAGGLALAGGSLAEIGRAWAQQAGKGKQRPNFVFILADDWGWGDLHCHGHGQLRTPNLDRLARQGTDFTQFYVANPVCSPSRTAFLTGQFPAHHRIHGHIADAAQNARRAMPNFLDPKVPTVTRLLQQAGYATGHFGKWHLGSGPGAPPPGAYGIDTHLTFASNDPEGAKMLGGRDVRPLQSERIVDASLRFIEANRNKPFYVNVWLHDVHAPILPNEAQQQAYAKLTGPARVYYAAATDADRQIGRLLAGLDDLGLADNTVVVFSTDNGPEDMSIANAAHSAAGSPGPFRGRKRSIYEGGVRVPFLVRWPGVVPAGRVDSTSILGAVDFLPTVCALTGVPVPGEHRLDGMDVGRALRGASIERAKPLFWEWRFHIFGHTLNRSPILAMRQGKWKLLMNPDRSRVELYDIPADPSEADNRADRNPDVVAAMSPRLLAWQATLPKGPMDPDAGSNAYPWPKKAGR